MAHELLLRGGYVVTVDDSAGDLPGGDILVRDDQIVAVGRNLSAPTRDAEVIDVTGRLVIPGLVDTRKADLLAAIESAIAQNCHVRVERVERVRLLEPLKAVGSPVPGQSDIPNSYRRKPTLITPQKLTIHHGAAHLK